MEFVNSKNTHTTFVNYRRKIVPKEFHFRISDLANKLVHQIVWYKISDVLRSPYKDSFVKCHKQSCSLCKINSYVEDEKAHVILF